MSPFLLLFHCYSSVLHIFDSSCPALLLLLESGLIKKSDESRTDLVIELIGQMVVGHSFLPFTFLVPSNRAIGVRECK